MQVLVFDKLDAGMPGTREIDDLGDRNPAVRFRHAALWGPLTASFSWPGTINEGYRWADERLGNPVEIYSPDGAWCWEGLIWSVGFGAGDRRRTRSLEAYANRIVINYQLTNTATDPPTVYGPVSSGYSDATQQAIYGVIERYLDGGQLAAVDANARAQAELATRTRLLWLPENGGANEASSITVECTGWWRTLNYRTMLGPGGFGGGLMDIGTITQRVLVPPAAPTLNAFISTDHSQVPTLGLFAYPLYDLATSAEMILHHLAFASGYIFGIGRGRVPYLRMSNRLSTSATYFEDEYGTITDAGGGEIPPWSIRPDSVLRQVDFAPASSLTTAAIDAIENIYLVETEYDSASNSVTYTPAVAGVLGEIGA